MRGIALVAAVVIFTVEAALGDLEGLFSGELDHPAIGYATRLSRDSVSALNLEIRQGLAQLKFEGTSGYLPSVLQALDVPIESQMLVFSKTSLMGQIINPGNPRSIFFNDSVAVGWVRGEPFVEVAAADPRQGTIFYTLNQSPVEQPQFIRTDFCLTCHESHASLGVPGMMVRSVFPAPTGLPVRPLGEYLSDHRSPWNERWGGWYVTGKNIALKHMGNAVFNPDGEASPTHKFDAAGYLSPYSDIVALMVFEHQMHAINLLTRVGWEVRLAIYNHSDSTARVLNDTARELADYLLFIDETPLSGNIEGSSGFTGKFSAQGPRDSQGRGLRQLDLERRLMRYPCSYMIYTKAFDGLPDEAREATYKRMWQILSGTEKSDRYARLSLADRQAIIEILRETKKGLPGYFLPLTPARGRLRL